MNDKIRRSLLGLGAFGRIISHPDSFASMARSAVGMAMHERREPSDCVASHSVDKETIIFVNGLASTPTYLGLIADHLTSDFNTVLPDFQPALDSFRSVQVQAASLARFLDRYVDQTDQKNVHLSGHSNGGPVSLEVLRLLDENSKATFNRIKSVITHSSPIYFPPDDLRYDLIHAPGLRRVPALSHLFSDEFYKLIAAYYQKISLCIVAGGDRFVPTQMQQVPGRPSVQIDMSHNWRRHHEEQIAGHAREAIFSLTELSSP